MFKANLIETNSFFTLRRRLLMISVLTGVTLILYLLIDSYFDWHSIWNILFILLIGVLYFGVKRKIWKSIQEASTKQTIQLSDEEIILYSINDQQETRIPLSKETRIELRKNYFITNDSLLGYFKEVVGKPISNNMVLEQNGQRQRFDFILDSDYSRKQLEKVIASWKEHGYALVRI